MKCRQCGKDFEPKVKWQKSCSLLCSSRWLNAHPNRQSHICKGCGKEFIPKVNDRLSYCSRECFFKTRKQRASEHQKERIEERIAEKANRRKICKVCGKEFKPIRNENYCSNICRRQKKRQRWHDKYAEPRKQKKISAYIPRIFRCKQCGEDVITEYGDTNSSFCSKRCSDRYFRKHGLASACSNHRKRARHYGCLYEWVNAKRILDRDNWHCRICGKSTPRELRGTIKSNAPELDHIIPLSRGGSHTYSNLQCVCRACNIRKSNNFGNQLILDIS